MEKKKFQVQSTFMKLNSSVHMMTFFNKKKIDIVKVSEWLSNTYTFTKSSD